MGGGNIGAGLCRVLPSARFAAVIAGLIALHFFKYSCVRYRCRSILKPNLIAVGVIAMMVCIEGEPDRLGCNRPDFRKDSLSARGEVGVDHQNVILEDDPTVVAMA